MTLRCTLLDLAVALRAGARDVVVVDARARVGVGQDVVRRVAGRADGGHGQALLEQTLAVDALGVVLEESGSCGMRAFATTGEPSRWHLPHSSGTFIVEVGEAGSSCGKMS